MIFQLLKNNIVKLKYQFKQLNIGFYVKHGHNNKEEYHTFEWNPNIDDQFLDKQCQLCCLTKQDQSVKLAQKEIYNHWKNQWV